MNNNFDTQLIDLMDLIDMTMSDSFISKWKAKYGERIIRLFQVKILQSFRKQKPLKLDSLIKFLSVDSGYNVEVVDNFLNDIDIELYYPIVLR